MLPSGQEGWGCADWLQSQGVDARLLRAGEVAAAGRRGVLALLEATAVGLESFVAAAGSGALAAAAREAHRPVWLVAGVGQRILSSVSKHLVGRFFTSLRKEFATPIEGAAE